MTPAHDPYGVPTGAVPRVQARPALKISADREAALLKVLEDYEAMQRKAAAWDLLRALTARFGDIWQAGTPVGQVLDEIEGRRVPDR